jgi:VWFA-related protein
MTRAHHLIGLLVLALCLLPSVRAERGPTVRYELDLELVLVDVVVTDRSGDPVLDLGLEDFELREDGVPQKIEVFELVGGAGAAPSAASAEDGRQAASADAGRTVVLLVDQMSTDQRQLRKTWAAVAEFAATALERGDRLALFSFHSDLELLRGFTRDAAGLAAFLESFEQRFRVGRHVFWPRDGARPESDPGLPSLAAFKDHPVHGAELGQQLYQSVIDVAEALAPIRGRKEIILLSAGFIEDEETILGLRRELKRALGAAQATLSTVDIVSPLLTGGDGEIARLLFRRESSLAELADLGRGRHTANASDIATALRRVRDTMPGYYLLGYYPLQPQMRRDYHTIEVRVRREGLRISARPGYPDRKHERRE